MYRLLHALCASSCYTLSRFASITGPLSIHTTYLNLFLWVAWMVLEQSSDSPGASEVALGMLQRHQTSTASDRFVGLYKQYRGFVFI